MSKIKANSKVKTNEYMNLARDSSMMNETNDCSVKAVAAVTGCSYREAHAALAQAGRRNRHGVTTVTIHRAISALGFHCIALDTDEIIAQYPKAHRILKSVTTHHPERFNKVWSKLGNVLMYSRCHVSASCNGRLHDWAKGRSLRVHSAYKVVRKDSEEARAVIERNAKIDEYSRRIREAEVAGDSALVRELQEEARQLLGIE